MAATVLLITPPFTQLNTTYPATAYLKGFLNTKHITSYQCDLGIEVLLTIFSKNGLTQLFSTIDEKVPLSANCERIITLKDEYIQKIDDVIHFLQGNNPTLAFLIAGRNFLPEAARFAQLDNLDWAFGNMGVQDKAKHIATLFLEDLSDLIKESVDEYFGFSRYAEKLGRSANSLDGLYLSLQKKYTYTDQLLLTLLQQKIEQHQPSLVALSVPFPGNLYAAFRCGQWIKKNHPTIKVALGGGFANTELRSVTDVRVFDFIDFITLDDGEMPIECLVNFITNNTSKEALKRTCLLDEGRIKYINNPLYKDYKQFETGTPDYSDLLLHQYISAIEVANPMHRLWSDGRWNKLTMAHGCYWGKCTFCDISLDYIKIYEPVAASMLCDRIETIIHQTGENGFHFTDEAAPPSLMKALAIEIIKRKIVINWWTNIRFEKSFTPDLCHLLKAAGCIAVSGGLEVASDRLLTLINKGVTVAQVAVVTKNFTEAGIMVHAYLMYGFPTQTEQETIDSLEMVRQLFKTSVLQSAFWHLFTMTAHSPIGLSPSTFKVEKKTTINGTFANNDIEHIDPTGADHEKFGFGLKKSLYNYMHQIGLDDPLQKWFDFPVPKTTITSNYILKTISEPTPIHFKPNAKIIWLGKHLTAQKITQTKKGNSRELLSIEFITNSKTQQVLLPFLQGRWFINMLPNLDPYNPKQYTLQEIKNDYEAAGLEDFELFWDNKPINTLYKMGLLKI